MTSISPANPLDLYYMPLPRVETSSFTISETFSEEDSSPDSPSSTLSVTRAVVMAPWTAGKKIIDFLGKKVRLAKALKEYRKTLFERRVEMAPAKAVYDVKTVPLSRISDLQKLIKNWQGYLGGLLKDKGSLSEEDCNKILVSDSMLDALYGTCMIKLNSKRMKSTKAESFLVALDSTGTVQAIAYVKRSYKPSFAPFEPNYKLEFLATAPSNLRLSFQKEGAKGAATALIEEIAFTCLRNSGSRRIKLISLDEAVDFYEKLGFTTPCKGSGIYSLDKASLLAFLTKFGGISTPNA